jgi:hypothetical protein
MSWVQDKPRPNQPAEAEHKGEQPDDAGDRRFVSELHLVEQSRPAPDRPSASRSELQRLAWGQTNLAQHIGDGDRSRVRAAPARAGGGQAGISRHPLAQIANERIDPARLAWTKVRWLQATSDAFANSLSVDPEFAGDRRDRQSLPMKIKYHDDFPSLITGPAPSFWAEQDRVIDSPPILRARPEDGRYDQLEIFQTALLGRITQASTDEAGLLGNKAQVLSIALSHYLWPDSGVVAMG